MFKTGPVIQTFLLVACFLTGSFFAPEMGVAETLLLGSIETGHDNVEVDGNISGLNGETWKFGGIGTFSLAVTRGPWFAAAGLQLVVEGGGEIAMEPFLLTEWRADKHHLWLLGTTSPVSIQRRVREVDLLVPDQWLSRFAWQWGHAAVFAQIVRDQAPADLKSELFSADLALSGTVLLNSWIGVEAGGGLYLRHRAGHDTGFTGWRRPPEVSGQLSAPWLNSGIFVLSGAGTHRLRLDLMRITEKEIQTDLLTAGYAWEKHFAADIMLSTAIDFDWIRGRIGLPEGPVPLREWPWLDTGSETSKMATLSVDCEWQSPWGPALVARIAESVRWRSSDPVWYNRSELLLRWKMVPLFRSSP